MCVGIYKAKGVVIDEKTFRICFANNDDGAGFAVIEKDENGKNELNIYKGIFSIEKFLETFEPYKEQQALIHFRIATHKYVNGANCHPWRVNDDLAFIHNGTISNINKNSEISDTGNFANEILAPLAKTDKNFWQRTEFKWFIENSIGSSNKLVLMDVKGNFRIFNEKAGEWENDNQVWYSNTSYRALRTKWSGGYANFPYVGITEEGFEEGEFDHVTSPSSKTKDTPRTFENRMGEEADTIINAEDTKTYDLDEIDALLEQENKKMQLTR